MKNSKISWTDDTFNLVWGCNEVSPGCDHCYAKGMANRLAASLAKRNGYDPESYRHVWGKDAPRLPMSKEYWSVPLEWNRAAAKARKHGWVFCSSMADIFEVHPTVEGELLKLWPLIEQTPYLEWLLLTKRYDQIRKKLPPDFLKRYPNAHMGVSVESQAYIYRVTEQVEWLSCEPLLGPIDLTKDHRGKPRPLPKSVKWVIVGGESGAGAREMKMDWARDLLRQCRQLGLAFHFKQTGEWLAKAIGLKDRHGKNPREWSRRPLLRNLPQDWPELKAR
jgi:protein gp37